MKKQRARQLRMKVGNFTFLNEKGANSTVFNKKVTNWTVLKEKVGRALEKVFGKVFSAFEKVKK